jgi:hypothetical protein
MTNASILRLLSLLSLPAFLGCAAVLAPGVGQPSFRVRSDFAAGLNADQGWAGALNEDVTINADQPFRVRFEIETTLGATAARQFRLQYRRNGGEWTDAERGCPHPRRRICFSGSRTRGGGTAPPSTADGPTTPTVCDRALPVIRPNPGP